jgi:protein subunit release factor A
MTLKSAINDRQEQHLIRFYHDRVTEHSIDETFKKRADYVMEGRFQNWIDDIYNV